MSEILPLIDATSTDIRTAREYLDVARLQLEQPATEAGRISSLNAVNSASNGLREATNRLQAILNQTMTLVEELARFQEVNDGALNSRGGNDTEQPAGGSQAEGT